MNKIIIGTLFIAVTGICVYRTVTANKEIEEHWKEMSESYKNIDKKYSYSFSSSSEDSVA